LHQGTAAIAEVQLWNIMLRTGITSLVGHLFNGRYAMRKFVCAASVLALVAAVGWAQDFQPVKPGPEHAKMKQLEGTWDAKVESEGKESKGIMTYKMGLGGLWMFEHFEGDFGGMKFEGKGATTYDPHKKKYINIWIDSMSTTPMISEGNFEKD